jgi:hypothetical protein
MQKLLQKDLARRTRIRRNQRSGGIFPNLIHRGVMTGIYMRWVERDLNWQDLHRIAKPIMKGVDR